MVLAQRGRNEAQTIYQSDSFVLLAQLHDCKPHQLHTDNLGTRFEARNNDEKMLDGHPDTWGDVVNTLHTKAMGFAVRKISFLVFSLIWIALCKSSYAGCVLPVADGTEKVVSNRNIAGFFAGIENNAILIKEYKTKNIVQIELAGLKAAYSAYGGDIAMEELKAGVSMRVWYKNCNKQKNGKSTAAYVEFFSNDLADKPPKDYFSAKGQ